MIIPISRDFIEVPGTTDNDVIRITFNKEVSTADVSILVHDNAPQHVKDLLKIAIEILQHEHDVLEEDPTARKLHPSKDHLN